MRLSENPNLHKNSQNYQREGQNEEKTGSIASKNSFAEGTFS